MKARLKGAQKGHSLLKKKVNDRLFFSSLTESLFSLSPPSFSSGRCVALQADALQLRFRSILRKIIDTKELMGQVRGSTHSQSCAETQIINVIASRVGDEGRLVLACRSHVFCGRFQTGCY